MEIVEEWVPLKYNGELFDRLLISNYGRIKNKIKDKILKTSVSKKGYVFIVVSNGSKKKYIKIHRAVAENFIENPNDYPQVNHIDGDKTNNSVENLEWCTNKQNSQHSIQNGLRKLYVNNKIKHVKCIEDDTEYSSIGEAGRAYANYAHSAVAARKNISRALLSKGTAYGKRWIYIDEVKTTRH